MKLLKDDFEVIKWDSLYEYAKNNQPEIIAWWNENLLWKVPLIHLTIQDRAMKILESWKLLCHKSLKSKNSRSVSDNLYINTDILDMELWLDEYVFLSLWKSNANFDQDFDPEDFVYFCFDTNNIWNIAWTIISEKEIAELWALVSKEWVEYVMNTKWFTMDKILDNNTKAIEKFYNTIMVWNTFEKMFPWFFVKYNISFIDFISSPCFPGDEVIKSKLLWKDVIHNYWQWFQFMVPDSVWLSWNLKTIVVWDNVKINKIKQYLNTKNIKIIRYSELVNEFNTATNKEFKRNPYLTNLLLFAAYNNKLKWDKIKSFVEKDEFILRWIL